MLRYVSCVIHRAIIISRARNSRSLTIFGIQREISEKREKVRNLAFFGEKRGKRRKCSQIVSYFLNRLKKGLVFGNRVVGLGHFALWGGKPPKPL